MYRCLTIKINNSVLNYSLHMSYVVSPIDYRHTRIYGEHGRKARTFWLYSSSKFRAAYRAAATESLSTFVLPCAMRVTSAFAKIYIYPKHWSTMYLMLWLYCFHPALILLFVVYLSHPCLQLPTTVTFTTRIYLCLRGTRIGRVAFLHMQFQM